MDPYNASMEKIASYSQIPYLSHGVCFSGHSLRNLVILDTGYIYIPSKQETYILIKDRRLKTNISILAIDREKYFFRI